MIKSKLKFNRSKRTPEESANNVNTEARAADLTQDNLITGNGDSVTLHEKSVFHQYDSATTSLY